MGRGTLGTSRGIAAATSAAAPTNSRPAAIQQHLVQAQRAIAREVDSLTPPRDGAWAGIGNQNSRRVYGARRTATRCSYSRTVMTTCMKGFLTIPVKG